MTTDELHATMQAEFKKVRQEIREIKEEIKEEGKTTRRHFDIMVERVSDSVKLVAEGTAHNTTSAAPSSPSRRPSPAQPTIL